MFTVCTNCKTRFKVTTAQLKAAGGQVRCGKCDQVFDAYETMDAKAKTAKPRTAAGETPEVAIRVGSETTPDLNVKLAVEAGPPAETLDLQPDLLKPDVPPIQDLFAGIADEPHEKPLPPPLTPDMHTLPKAKAAPEISFVPVADLPAPPPPKPKRPAHTAAWWSGIALLALLLGVQLVHADREALGQNLVIGPSLKALYAAFGDPLPAAESVTDWDVSGVNVTTDPATPGALSITGTLTNQASYAQPWPFLRVVLTDRYGETLRARDFKPDEYLPGTQANVQLAGGLTSHFRLDIVDPGADAVGFTLTPCLDISAGRVCSVSERD
jgi:predicted Zn finger-like uncharacterized protein